MVHTLEKTSILHASLAEAWSFFATPKNLQRITPPRLKFIILSRVPEEMYPGLIIRYRVNPLPLLPLPMTWVTEITHIERQRFFVDEQRVGPYKMWHHEHHFRDLGDGRIEMNDIVTYQLPFSPFSDVFHPLLVRPELDNIFAYREKVISEVFGPKNHSA